MLSLTRTTQAHQIWRRRNPAAPKSLVVALAVYPHEEPGVGPNIYNFDDDVLYEIHVATGRDVAAGRATISYQFRFTTTFKNQNTILDSYLGVINDVRRHQSEPRSDVYGHQGHLALEDRPRHGHGPTKQSGYRHALLQPRRRRQQPGKGWRFQAADLDRYTQQAITSLKEGLRRLCRPAGRRLLRGYQLHLRSAESRGVRARVKDSQGGFNLHLMALNIPIEELGRRRPANRRCLCHDQPSKGHRLARRSPRQREEHPR